MVAVVTPGSRTIKFVGFKTTAQEIIATVTYLGEASVEAGVFVDNVVIPSIATAVNTRDDLLAALSVSKALLEDGRTEEALQLITDTLNNKTQ
jgi:hypothetical protein